MKMDRLREIVDELSEFATGERAQITFIAGTEKLWLSVLSSTDQRYKKIQELVANYENEFIRIEHHRTPDSSLDWAYLDKINFLELSRKMAAGLQADIECLIENPPSDPIYAFVVGISPEHYSMEVRVNSSSKWDATKTSYEESDIEITSSTKYWAPNFDLNCKLADITHWQPVYDLLQNVEKITREHFDLTNGSANFTSIYTRRFTQMAVLALKQNIHLFRKLEVTKDFVCYVQDYVGNGDDFYTALETVPLDRAMEMYSDQIKLDQ